MYRSPMSAQEAQAGPMDRSLPKKVKVNSRPSIQTSWVQRVARKAGPASPRPSIPT